MPSYRLFLDKPEEYLQSCWSEGKKNFEQISTRLQSNWKLYNLVSDALAERAALGDGRANLFIPLINPSIDSRVATIVAEILGNIEVLNFKATPNNPNRDLATQKASNCNAAVDFAMNFSDWDTKLTEWITSAEIYPVAFVKIFIDEVYKDEPVIENILPEQLQGLSLERLMSSLSEVKFKKKLVYRGPVFELVSPHEILYDYNVIRIEDSPFIIHRKRVDYFYLKERFKDKISDELLERQEPSQDLNDYAWEEEDQVGRGQGREVHKNNYTLAEAWIKTVDESGYCSYKVYWFLPELSRKEGEKKLEILDESTPEEMNMAGIGYPFEPLVIRPRPNKLEGMATADLLTPLQHELSDLHNQLQDTLTYTLYPQLLQESGAVISPRQPTFSPREIWTVSRADAVKPLHIPAINLEHIYASIKLIRETAQNTSASEDYIMGSSFVKADTTLGEARIKHAGAGRRIGLSILQVYKSVRKLKHKMLTILRQTISPELEIALTGQAGQLRSFTAEDLLVNVDIFIPTLPALADKALKQVQADRHYERLMTSPLVATNPVAQFQVLKHYLDEYEYDPLTKKAVLDAIMPQVMKMQQEIQKMEIMKAMGVQPPEQTETTPAQIPKTPENLAASVVG